MDHKNDRARGKPGAGGLRVLGDFDTHHGPDRPQGKSQRDRARALLTALRTEYPVLSRYKPLALGIRVAVHAAVPSVTGRIVNCALARHCRCDKYLQAVAAGGTHFGLDGAPSGDVSEAHRAAVVLVLARRAGGAIKPRPPAKAPLTPPERTSVAGAVVKAASPLALKAKLEAPSLPPPRLGRPRGAHDRAPR